MSSLGDLLLFHSKANKAEKVSESESCGADNKKTVKNRETNQEPTSQSSNFPSQFINSSNDDTLIEIEKVQKQSSPPSGLTKVFPKHIERNEVEETQSNASSTDDYVRELLDPDDRPRNVWHVVEGPKVQQNDDNSSNNNLKFGYDSSEEREPSSRPSLDDGESLNQSDVGRNLPDIESSNDLTSSAIVTPSTPPLPGSPTQQPPSPPPPPPSELIDKPNKGETDVDIEESGKKHLNSKEERLNDDRKSTSRTDRKHRSSRHDSRERSSSSRRHRHKDDRDRDRYRNRSKEREDRHRSRRRHDYSDDEEDDYNRHRSSNRRRRSHSKSSRTSSSRRRERSRSNSPSPLTKRNSRTILIMQLSPRVTSRDLEDFFSDIGKVREVRLIMDSKTRRHKGIAYIEFEDSHAATKASALNGKKLFGVPLAIQSAQLDRNRPSSGDWHSSTSHHQTSNYKSAATTSTSHTSSRSYIPPNCYRVYVGGLNIHLTEDMIRSVFEPFGPIVRIELMKDRVTNVSRGYAFVTYADSEDGQSAVQALDGFELAGKNLRVSKSTDKSERYPANTGATSTTTNNDYGQSSGLTDTFNDDDNPYANHHKYK